MNHRYTFVKGIKNENGICIYEAFDEVTLKNVLVKAVSQKAGSILLHQYNLEAQVLCSLNRHGIPRLLDLEESEDACVLYEEFIEGENLNQWLLTKPAAHEKRKIFRQIVDLIMAVHETGYLYLDLKPDNILIHNDQAWLIDFNAVVPIGSKSIQLCHPDVLPWEYQKETLTEKADQIGLGLIHRKMFGFSRISWICLQKKPEKRFPDLEKLKDSVKPLVSRRMAWSFGVFALSFLSIATSLLYSKEEDTITDAAALERKLMQENYSTRNLYDDLLCGKADPELLSQTTSLSILLQNAAEEKNVPLCRYLLESADKNSLEKLQRYCVKAAHIAGIPIFKSQIDAALNEIITLQDPSEGLGMLIEVLLDQDLMLDYKQTELFQTALDRIEFSQKEEAMRIMQYILLLSSYGIEAKAPDSILDALKTERQGLQLAELYQHLQFE